MRPRERQLSFLVQSEGSYSPFCFELCYFQILISSFVYFFGGANLFIHLSEQIRYKARKGKWTLWIRDSITEKQDFLVLEYCGTVQGLSMYGGVLRPFYKSSSRFNMNNCMDNKQSVKFTSSLARFSVSKGTTVWFSFLSPLDFLLN